MENQILNIPIKQIAISGLNDRKVFDPDTLKELADSIKMHGLLQNLTVRKNGKANSFELVTGERRYKAAQLAGLVDLPCKILELSDTEFKEVMLVENLQRENIHPLDEAESFLRLSDTLKESDIALRVGKPVKYIKERIALNNLTSKGKDLFRNSTMQLGHALVLCLFQKQQQNQAIDQVIRREDGFKYFDHPQELKEYMQRHVLCSLSNAIFDVNDADLLPQAGACSTCTKQTGADSELFACVTSEAKCTDPICFVKKEKMYITIQNKQLLQELNIKKSVCATISNSSYSYEEGVLNSSKWRPAKKADECTSVTIGFLQIHNQPDRAVMICTDKKCKVHFREQARQSISTVPENEKPSETLSRRLANRREREVIEDYHTARKQLMDKALKVRLNTPNEFELAYLVRILVGRGSSRALQLAQSLGFKHNDESSYFFDWIDDFMKFTSKSDNQKQVLTNFLRALIMGENLQPENKYVATMELEDDILRQHGKALGIDFNPILKETFKARKEIHLQEDQQVKDQVKVEREKEKKIKSLFKNAETEYPELFAAIEAKNKKVHLQQQPIETLSRMAYRIGLKRRKDGTIDYYASEIAKEIKSRHRANKGAK